MRIVVPLLTAAAIGHVAAPASAAKPLPKIPADTAMVLYIDNPSRTLARAEAMAARIGLAPPEAPAGWLAKAPALAWTQGQVDLTRPLYAALTRAETDTPATKKAAKQKKTTAPEAPPSPLEEVFGELLVYVPVAKGANPDAIIAGLSDGTEKLYAKKDGGYLVISEDRRVLPAARRPRRLDAEALKVARPLDVAALFADGAFDAKLAEEVLPTDAATDRFEDRLLKALAEVAVELAQASSPKGAWALLGLDLAKDGLRITSQSRMRKDSLLGAWLLKTPRAAPTHFVGHPPGPLIGGFGTRLDADATVAVVEALFAGAKKRLSAPDDEKELAELAALGPALEAAWRAHPALSVVARPGRSEAPRVVAVLPRVPDAVRAKLPDLQPRPADPKLGLPKHLRVQVDPETYAYVLDTEARSVVAVGYTPGSLKDLLRAAAEDTDPTKGEARFTTARAAIGAGLVFEAYLDPGPLADVLLRDPSTARFRPLARLLGMAPPVVLGAAVEGDVVRTDLFVPEALLGVAGMAFAAMRAGAPGGPGAGDGPSDGPSVGPPAAGGPASGGPARRPAGGPPRK